MGFKIYPLIPDFNPVWDSAPAGMGLSWWSQEFRKAQESIPVATSKSWNGTDDDLGPQMGWEVHPVIPDFNPAGKGLPWCHQEL